jgi:gamma-F420-2:alpha-L-glutamate ligase
VGIITHTNNPEVYEFRRLHEELTARGMDVKHLQPHRFAATIGARPGLLYNGKRFEPPPFVLSRLGAGTESYAALIIRQMAAMGATVVNTLGAAQAARNKAYTMQLAAADGLPIPETMIHPAKGAVVDAWKLGYPCIIKKAVGSRGNGVMLIRDPCQLSAIAGIFKSSEPREFLIQKYIDDRPGCDIRVLVIGGKAIGAMMRTAREGEARANISRGGKGELYPLTPKSIELSERVAQLLGLEIAGIDLLFSCENYALCEANSSPGFEGFEKYCDVDVAGMIADYIGSRLNSRLDEAN